MEELQQDRASLGNAAAHGIPTEHDSAEIDLFPASAPEFFPAPGDNATARPRRRHVVHAWVRDLGLSLIASFLIITFLYQPVRVEGTSMLPQLEDQERLFINKFTYRFSDVQRGDVVVFNYPRDPAKSYIKRVVAGPGDNLRIDRGLVFVNGQPLTEMYVPPQFHDDRSYPETVIPPHMYFVMGDHRSISSDSRDFGLVDRSLIYGKAQFVFWPSEKIGEVR